MFPDFRHPKAYVSLILLIVMFLVPVVMGTPFWTNLFVLLFVFSALSVAWNIVGGYAGQLSLGHAVFYGIGGYTHTMYKNLPIRVNGLAANGAIIVAPGTNDWQHQNGWNAGGGASLGWGRTELFLETRVLAFNNDNIPQARQMPFIFGINLY